MVTKSGFTTDKSNRLVGINAAASSKTSHLCPYALYILSLYELNWYDMTDKRGEGTIPITYILEITILNFLNPAERIFHSSKVIFSRVGKQTVGEVLIMHTQHVIQIFFYLFHASVTRGEILLVQNTETTSKSVCILTNSKNRIVVLLMSSPHFV